MEVDDSPWGLGHHKVVKLFLFYTLVAVEGSQAGRDPYIGWAKRYPWNRHGRGYRPAGRDPGYSECGEWIWARTRRGRG